MATSQPTSRQLKGHFNALRASKSHSAAQTIDIAAGTYGSGKVFGGATGVSAAAWVGATDTFYVYLDETDSLVLDGANFPVLSTRIATVVLNGGTITDVVDERAEVNGLTDAYQVFFDDAGLTVVQGDDVQEALESLDAYVSALPIGQDLSKSKDFGILDGVKNGNIRITSISETPALEFVDKPVGLAKVSYSVSIPKDYVTGTNIIVKVFWSPADATAGNVNWRLRHRLVASGLENVDSGLSTLSYVQAAPGVANRLNDTGENLTISSGTISEGDTLFFNIERVFDGSDTYTNSVHVHLIRLEYTGRGVE